MTKNQFVRFFHIDINGSLNLFVMTNNSSAYVELS